MIRRSFEIPSHTPAALLSPIALAILLAGCGSGGDGAPPATGSSPTVAPVSAQIVPSLGKTFAADVRVIAPGGGGPEVAELARAKTDNGGEAEIEIPGDRDGPFIVEVRGNDAATYFDEGSGTELPLQAGDVIRTVLPGLPGNGEGIAVTPLTELACKYLEATHGPLELLSRGELADIISSGQLDAAFEHIRAELAPEISGLEGINTLPKLIGNASDYAALGAGDGDLYALKLAALARVAHDNGAARPALAMMNKLARDIADGKVDGHEGLVAMTTDVYDANLLAKQLRDASHTLGTSTDLQSALPLLQQFASDFLVALSEMHDAATTGGGGGSGGSDGGGTPTLPGDLLASWLGNYHGDWQQDVEAEVYVWPFGWQEDKLTEASMKTAMSLMTFGGDSCNWVVGVQDVQVGNLVVPFTEAYGIAAAGEARTYRLPTTVKVLDYGFTGLTVIDTQGVLPTKITVSNEYNGLLHRIRYNATCTFTYKT